MTIEFKRALEMVLPCPVEMHELVAILGDLAPASQAALHRRLASVWLAPWFEARMQEQQQRNETARRAYREHVEALYVAGLEMDWRVTDQDGIPRTVKGKALESYEIELRVQPAFELHQETERIRMGFDQFVSHMIEVAAPVAEWNFERSRHQRERTNSAIRAELGLEHDFLKIKLPAELAALAKRLPRHMPRTEMVAALMAVWPTVRDDYSRASGRNRGLKLTAELSPDGQPIRGSYSPKKALQWAFAKSRTTGS